MCHASKGDIFCTNDEDSNHPTRYQKHPKSLIPRDMAINFSNGEYLLCSFIHLCLEKRKGDACNKVLPGSSTLQNKQAKSLEKTKH